MYCSERYCCGNETMTTQYKFCIRTSDGFLMKKNAIYPDNTFTWCEKAYRECLKVFGDYYYAERYCIEEFGADVFEYEIEVVEV